MTKIKKFNIEELCGGSKEEVLGCLKKDGLIHICGIDQDPIDKLYAEIVNFFNSPLRKKYNLGINPYHGGYSTFEIDEEKKYPLEIFVMGGKSNDFWFDSDLDVKNKILEIIGVESISDDTWPTFKDFPNFQSAFTKVYEYYNSFCKNILDMSVHCTSLIDAVKYPALTKNVLNLKLKPQVSFADIAFSLPNKNNLEVLTKEHGWIPASPEKGEMLIMQGMNYRIPKKVNEEKYSLTFIQDIHP